MSKHVAIICEGKTEEIFCNELLVPYFAREGIFVIASQITKPGQKGGNVRYSRMLNDVTNYLHQPHLNCVTTFFDFYGLSGSWPEYENAKGQTGHKLKNEVLTEGVKNKVADKLNCAHRFLPFFAMHETEAYYYSCPASMSQVLGVRERSIQAILSECGEPEAINHRRETSPSHRIATLLGVAKFTKKTTTGIAIARAVGLPKMIESCPLFAQWLEDIEEYCN